MVTCRSSNLRLCRTHQAVVTCSSRNHVHKCILLGLEFPDDQTEVLKNASDKLRSYFRIHYPVSQSSARIILPFRIIKKQGVTVMFEADEFHIISKSSENDSLQDGVLYECKSPQSTTCDHYLSLWALCHDSATVTSRALLVTTRALLTEFHYNIEI